MPPTKLPILSAAAPIACPPGSGMSSMIRSSMNGNFQRMLPPITESRRSAGMSSIVVAVGSSFGDGLRVLAVVRMHQAIVTFWSDVLSQFSGVTMRRAWRGPTAVPTFLAAIFVASSAKPAAFASLPPLPSAEAPNVAAVRGSVTISKPVPANHCPMLVIVESLGVSLMIPLAARSCSPLTRFLSENGDSN